LITEEKIMTNEYRLHNHDNGKNETFYADRHGRLVRKKSYSSITKDENFYEYLSKESNQNYKQSKDLVDSWVEFTDDDYTYLNTYTFRNRRNRWTQDYDVPPSEDLVKSAMEEMELKFLNDSTWYGDMNSRMFTTLEVGEEKGRLHLHSLVKNEKTENKKDSWLWGFNSWWSDNYGYYNSRSIDSNTAETVREYVLKANRYVHKDNNKFSSKYFPYFWDWK
tara:strand:+ start:463 stop:1125 length:663 start_codon:yes stop_codon:yes gene_type:complete